MATMRMKKKIPPMKRKYLKKGRGRKSEHMIPSGSRRRKKT